MVAPSQAEPPTQLTPRPATDQPTDRGRVQWQLQTAPMRCTSQVLSPRRLVDAASPASPDLCHSERSALRLVHFSSFLIQDDRARSLPEQREAKKVRNEKLSLRKLTNQRAKKVPFIWQAKWWLGKKLLLLRHEVRQPRASKSDDVPIQRRGPPNENWHLAEYGLRLVGMLHRDWPSLCPPFQPPWFCRGGNFTRCVHLFYFWEGHVNNIDHWVYEAQHPLFILTALRVRTVCLFPTKCALSALSSLMQRVLV